MSTNTTLLGKGLLQLLLVLALLIISPLLLSVSFKGFNIYKEGIPFWITIIIFIVAVFLIIFTIYRAFKAFRTISKAIFNS